MLCSSVVLMALRGQVEGGESSPQVIQQRVGRILQVVDAPAHRLRKRAEVLQLPILLGELPIFLGEDGAGEICAREVCALEVGEAEVGTLEIGTREIGTR